VPLSPADWDLIRPYLKENEKLFGISLENDLLKVKGESRSFSDVYIKVQPRKAANGNGANGSAVTKAAVAK
jgi:hypothetical protein